MHTIKQHRILTILIILCTCACPLFLHATDFYDACENGDLESVKKLLTQHNINKQDANGNIPLNLAAKGRHFEVFHFLLEKGADINILDIAHRNALHAACAGKKFLLTKEIIKKYPGLINKRDSEDETPLYIACREAGKKIASLLLKHKADHTLSQKDKNSPLHCAVQHAYVDLMLLLINYKANVNALNEAFLSPLDIAYQINDFTKFLLLIENGAHLNAGKTFYKDFGKKDPKIKKLTLYLQKIYTLKNSDQRIQMLHDNLLSKKYQLNAKTTIKHFLVNNYQGIRKPLIENLKKWKLEDPKLFAIQKSLVQWAEGGKKKVMYKHLNKKKPFNSGTNSRRVNTFKSKKFFRYSRNGNF